MPPGQLIVSALTGAARFLVLGGTYAGSPKRHLDLGARAMSVEVDADPDECVVECAGDALVIRECAFQSNRARLSKDGAVFNALSLGLKGERGPL